MPKVVRSAKRQTILEVYAFCEKEKAENKLIIPLAQVRARVAAMTNVSESTVTRILRQERDACSDSNLPGPSKVRTPGKKRPNRVMNINIDDFDVCAIRQKIMSFYAVRKEIPTLNKLLIELRNEINFEGGRTTLWKILKRLGYKYKKCQSKQKILMERTNIAAWRFNYLNQIRQFRDEGRTIVYLMYMHCGKEGKCQQAESRDSVMVKSTNKDRRWIVAHAGTKQGFINNALLLFKSQAKSSDYQDNMNCVNFMRWLEKQVLPNLPPNCVIVMDNAPYHTVQINKTPNMTSLKADMVEWLQNKGLVFSPNVTKNVLYELVKKNKSEPMYKADELIKAHGHNVLRLPPYHVDLNPIESICSEMKKRLAEKNVARQTKDQVESIVKETLGSISADTWKNECSHVIITENEYRMNDKLIDEGSDRFLYWVGSDSDESDSDSELSSSNEEENTAQHLIDHTYIK